LKLQASVFAQSRRAARHYTTIGQAHAQALAGMRIHRFPFCPQPIQSALLELAEGFRPADFAARPAQRRARR
jgi:hypothetical protein